MKQVINEGIERDSIIDINALTDVIGCTIQDTSLYNTYKLDEMDFLNSHSYLYIIYKHLSKLIESGITNIPVDILDKYISKNDEVGYESIKKKIGNASVESILNKYVDICIPENIIYNYSRVKKFSILREAFDKKLDITNYISPNSETDPNILEAIINRLETSTPEEIKEYFHNATGEFKTTISDSFDPFKGYNYLDIPGADKPIEWLINNLFQVGTFNLAIGPAKSGKSQLCYQLAYCLSNGIDFFGQKSKKSKVLYIDFELSPREIKHRMDLIQNFYEHGYKETPIMVPLYRTDYAMADLVKGIKRAIKNNPGIDVIFYDNFYSFFDGDANSSSAVKKVLKSIQSVSQTATIFLICHTTKADGQKGGSDSGIYAASGSNAFGGFADEFMNIEKKVDGRVVSIEGRHVSPAQEIACRFNKETYWQFAKIDDESEIKNMIFNNKTADELKEQYPELSEFIGDEGKTTNQIKKQFPTETTNSLKEKGFYIERNKDRCREGFKSCRWYLEDPVKNRIYFQK